MAQKVREIAKLARRYGQEDWKRAYGVVCYCVEHWTYERTGTEYTAYSALVQNKAVCMGFSLAMCMIMKELGIPCRYVSGKRQGNGHGWNLIYLKGGWFYIDVTDAVCRKDPLYHWGMVNMVLNRTLYQRKIKKNCKIKKPMDGALCRIQLHNVPSFIWLYRSYGL